MSAFIGSAVQRPLDSQWLSPPDHVSVFREYPTHYIQRSRRQIDILVTMNKDGRPHALAIENKPSAVESSDQVRDYVEHLEKAYHDRFVFVFLTSDGRMPTSINKTDCDRLMADGKLRVASYKRDIRHWLEACAKAAEAARTRWFLEDFMRYVEREFGC